MFVDAGEIESFQQFPQTCRHAAGGDRRLEIDQDRFAFWCDQDIVGVTQIEMHNPLAVHGSDLLFQPREKRGRKFTWRKGFERTARNESLGQRKAVEAYARRRREAARLDTLQERAFAPYQPDAERPAQRQEAGTEVFDEPFVAIDCDAPTVGIAPFAFLDADPVSLLKGVSIKFHAR